MGGPITERLLKGPMLGRWMAVFVVVVLLQALVHFFGFRFALREGLTDFDAFWIVGRMVWEGTLYDAYSAPLMFEAQRRFTGWDSFMPWSYPPQFDLIVAPLGLLSVGWAFALFVLATSSAYFWILWKIAGRHLPAVLLAVAPIVQINLKSGQNGFLTGALIGAFCLAMMRGRPMAAGLPLGVMVIKPHLGLGLGVWLLAGRRWAAIAVAAAVVAGSSALATVAFGPGIWTAFLNGAQEASGFLKEGQYPLYRMTSLFAALKTQGVPAEIALGLHGAVALGALATAAWAATRVADRRLALGIAVLCSVLVSPYNYDYDLTLLGVSLALLAPAFLERARDRDVLLLVLSCWAATGSGLAVQMRYGSDLMTDLSAVIGGTSYGFWGLLGVLLVMRAVLARNPHQAARSAAVSP